MFRINLTTALLGLACTVQAADSFVTPDHPTAFGVTDGWARPTSLAESQADRTTFQKWDAFNTWNGPNTPTGVYGSSFNDAGTPNAASGSFSLITGGGNLYSPFGNITPYTTTPLFTSGVTETHFVVQLRVTGSTMDWTQLSVDATDDAIANPVLYSTLDDASHTFTVNISEVFQPPEGEASTSYTQEHLWTFSVLGDPASVRVNFGSWPLHTSLDVLSVDTISVPEPATLGMLAIGSFLIGRRRRS